MHNAPTRPLQVLLAGHCRSPIAPPFAGGLEAVTWHLARGLAARGHEVTLFGAAESDAGPGVAVLTPEELGVGIAPQRPWVETREDVSRTYARLAEVLPALGTDVVHNNTLNPTLLEAVDGTPIITSLHTPPLLPMVRALRRRPQAPGRVTAVSAFTARQWQPSVHATVVHNGVDPAAWPLGPGGEELVWFGRLVPEKGPEVAVAMARRLGIPLRLVGPRSDPGYFEDRIRPLLGGGARGGGVEYLGHLGGPELAEVVGSSLATLATPLWDEPFGLVAAESAACGTPVVALARGGLSEVVTPRTGRLLDPYAWGLGLEAATAQATALDRATVRETAVRRFSLERMVDEHEALCLRAALDGAAVEALP